MADLLFLKGAEVVCRVLLRIALVCGCCYSQASLIAADQFFETRIRPVLVERCAKCQGSQKASSGLRVDSLEALRNGFSNAGLGTGSV